MKTYKRYEQMQHAREKLSPRDEFIFTKLRNSLSQFSKELKTLQNRKDMIEQKMFDFGRAFIKIEYSAEQNTVFKFGKRTFVVRDSIIGPKSVRLIHGEIKLI
jgi:hypothetical protein